VSEKYDQFLESKVLRFESEGVSHGDLNPHLYGFQRAITERALEVGRYCIFADCGLGKTLMQLSWAERIPGPVLIFAPLAVRAQTVREAQRFGIDCSEVDSQADVRSQVSITNYEKIDHFDLDEFVGIVLDESSILKSYTGVFRTKIIESTAQHKYKLACTATPSPNDFMELGNHAEFVGAMTRTEMLSMFFVHDGGSTQNWRIKGHAVDEFWNWVLSWSVMIQRPSQVGFSDDGFDLPELRYVTNRVSTEFKGSQLLPVSNLDLNEKRQLQRSSIADRCAKAIDLASQPGQWIVWCELNDESAAVARAVPGAVEVKGGDSDEHKRKSMLGFADGKVRVLVTKPKIAGFGMNWQNCHNMVFVGLSDSYEALYQATRRCWRFGQTEDVTAHIVTTDQDIFTLKNVLRKEANHKDMQARLGAIAERVQKARTMGTTMHEKKEGAGWTMHNGDCVKVMQTMDAESVDYAIFSPPFSSLYTYSNHLADMGNSTNHEQFMEHYGFLANQLFRVIRSGRLVSVHCMLLPTLKARDGVIGLMDFRGDIIRAMAAVGFIHHSEVVIWKDPVMAMQRTKAVGLLHKQIRKDSAMSRQGIPDYVVTFRKPGENTKPISHDGDVFPVSLWQRWASPIWTDIKPSDTLQYMSARESEDERHICPLQLEVIKRCLALWSAPEDMVLSPFAGIASEGVESLKWGRKFVGIELKRSYFDQAVSNLGVQVDSENQMDMFK